MGLWSWIRRRKEEEPEEIRKLQEYEARLESQWDSVCRKYKLSEDYYFPVDTEGNKLYPNPKPMPGGIVQERTIIRSHGHLKKLWNTLVKLKVKMRALDLLLSLRRRQSEGGEASTTAKKLLKVIGCKEDNLKRKLLGEVTKVHKRLESTEATEAREESPNYWGADRPNRNERVEKTLWSSRYVRKMLKDMHVEIPDPRTRLAFLSEVNGDLSKIENRIEKLPDLR